MPQTAFTPLPWRISAQRAARLEHRPDVRAGFEVVTYARLFGADANTACCQHITAQEPFVFEGVDASVIGFGRLSDRELEREIDGICVKCHIIGDCLAPRTADETALEGLKAGFRF